MKRDEVLCILKAHQADLKPCAVKSLAIFGSVARDEARSDSDVDILAEFDKPIGLFEFVRFKNYLEQVLGQSVDLATPDALKARMREQILREAIRAT